MQATKGIRPKFEARSTLRREIEARVDDYFERTGLERTGGARMVFKTCVILTWAAASYGLLVFWASTWWTALPLCVSLGLALAGIGFSVMHDGGHGSYSRRRSINRLTAASLDALGGSSYMWNQKHNVLHHTYTNVDGVDDDIDARPFLRLSPDQPRRWFHRFQHLYFPFLMVFFTTKWVLVDDFRSLASGAIGGQRIPRPRGWELVQFFAGKVSFVSWALVVPLLVHPVVPFLAGYVVVSAVWGITLGVVFQLAHASEGADFAEPPRPGAHLARPWVEHQLATTVDFARGSRVLTWYLGGLNFQVEHHLFPRIGHRHYPALSEIVREVCRERGVQHLEHATFLGALGAHLRFLKRMGRGQPLLVRA